MVVDRLPTAEPNRVPVIRPQPEVVMVENPPAPVPLRVRVLPVVGAALSWTGRELVPRLACYLLDELDRRASGPQASRIARGDSYAPASGGGGRQQRRRHRGGQDGPA